MPWLKQNMKKIKNNVILVVIIFIIGVVFVNPKNVNAATLYGYICSGDSISCSSLSAIFKIYQYDLNTYYICDKNSFSCSSLSAVYWVERYDEDTYYVCSGDSIGCSLLNDIYRVEVHNSDTMYVCSGDSIGCSLLNDIYQVEKYNNYAYYVCSGNSLGCSSLSDIYKVQFINNNLNNNPNDDSYYNICSSNSMYVNGQCVCNDGYIASGGSCVTYTQNCQNRYGINSYGDKSYCYCVSGYRWNNTQTACILAVTPIPIPTPIYTPIPTLTFMPTPKPTLVSSQIEKPNVYSVISAEGVECVESVTHLGKTIEPATDLSNWVSIGVNIPPCNWQGDNRFRQYHKLGTLPSPSTPTKTKQAIITKPTEPTNTFIDTANNVPGSSSENYNIENKNTFFTILIKILKFWEWF